MDNDGYIDVYYFILEGPSADLPLHVDENDSIEIAFAEEVQFRTDPIEKLDGECGSSVVVNNGDEDEVDELPAGEGESEGKSEPVPVGTYIGDNGGIPPDWELVEGEFIIEVAGDGTVSGSRIYIIKKESVGGTCTWRWENGHTTSISGYISGANGYVTVENDSYTISDSSDCGGSNNHQTFESVCDAAQITISGEQMEIHGDGSSGCGIVFTATKQ